ncbi:MAG: hypothetical protein KBT45_03830 [Bacteroidales bacterium]|nr:hypothetical protein [Candidatus Colimorpha pelethequi]
MKKYILAIAAVIMIVGAISLAACDKEALSSTNEVPTTSNTKAKPMSKAMKAFLLANGIEIEAGCTYTVTYRSGCYHTKDILWGAYHSVDCETGCQYCELIGVKKNGVTIKTAIKPNNNTGRYGLDIDPATEDMHDGLMYISDYALDPRVYFFVDINNVIDSTVYNGDSLRLESPFAINYELAVDARILGKDQIVPAGNYKLERFDDVVLWSVPLSGLLSEKEKDYYQNLIELNQNE